MAYMFQSMYLLEIYTSEVVTELSGVPWFSGSWDVLPSTLFIPSFVWFEL